MVEEVHSTMSGSFREAFGEALVEAGEVIKDLVVIDTDVASSTRTIYFAKRFPDRFIQVGISEQDAAGTAAGLAIAGKIPVLVAYSMFLLRSWEQIRNTIARDNINVKLVGTHSGLSDYLDGSSHQCLEDVALMRVLPNMTVVSPSDEVSTRSLLHQILGFRGPTYFRLGRDNAPSVYEDEDDVEVGKANVLVDGGDLTIISCGALVSVALEAAKRLRGGGLRVRVIDMHTIKPLDVSVVERAARDAPPIFTLEEHNVYGGLGSAVAEVLSERLPTRICRLGVGNEFGTGGRSYEELLQYFRLTPEYIVEKIRVVLDGV
jgi:transketolase